MASNIHDKYWFSKSAAQRAEDWFGDMLVFTKGEWAGREFKLENWQKVFIRRLFGWKRRDGSGKNGKGDDATRRYRTAYMEVPRKNGKSEFVSAIATYLLYADREPGAEIYAAAADRFQASRVFEPAKFMVMENQTLADASTIYKRNISRISDNSFYTVLSADAYTKHGLNAHGVMFDELHVQKNRDLYDTLKTSMGSRRQPLMVIITTAGIYDPASIAWEIHSYAEGVISGAIEDDTFLAVIFKAKDNDDWTDPKVWEKANPNIDVSLKREYLEESCKEAQSSPAKENTFRRLHLNQWTQQITRWVSIDKWDRCEREFDEESLYGMQCYGGLDLGSVSDLTSFVLAFPDDEDNIRFLSYAWCPEARVRAKNNPYADQYIAWAREGHLIVTQGDTVDYKQVKADIIAAAEKFRLIDFNVDRLFQADQLTQELAEEGMTPVPMGQGFYSMAAPMREFEDRLLSERIHHNGDPLLRWAVNNVVVRHDPAGNVKPDKGENPQAKIDPFVSMVMALERIMRHEDMGSVYSDRAATGEEMITWIE